MRIKEDNTCEVTSRTVLVSYHDHILIIDLLNTFQVTSKFKVSYTKSHPPHYRYKLSSVDLIFIIEVLSFAKSALLSIFHATFFYGAPAIARNHVRL